MENQYILLWLESPLQAWGVDSKFGRRDTLPFPTRSGVLGIICAAMGASGEQRELLKRFKSLPQTVYAFVQAKEENGKKTKKQREPLLYDFQMVGSGYDEEDSWETLLIPKTPAGTRAVGGGTKLTYRYYLQDAFFAVVLELPPDLATLVALSLQNPVFDIYLGRKTCVPSDFVYRGCYTSFDEAVHAMNDIAKNKQLIPDFKVIDGEHPEENGDMLALNDVPIQFGINKKYQDRRVTIIAMSDIYE
jgi:CRISPR system Cascade subunit CasD